VINGQINHNLTCKALEKIRLITALNTHNLFPQTKLGREVHIYLHCIFMPSWKYTAKKIYLNLENILKARATSQMAIAPARAPKFKTELWLLNFNLNSGSTALV